MTARKTKQKRDNPQTSKTIKEKERKIEELNDRLKYLHAEFDNYRKYVEKEMKRIRSIANENLIKALLPIIDDFENALSSINDAETRKGVEMIFSKLMKVLADFGLKRINARGKLFDPYYHEAVLSEESDKDEGTIIEELQAGYMLNNAVIRHSKVKIAKKNKNHKEDKSE